MKYCIVLLLFVGFCYGNETKELVRLYKAGEIDSNTLGDKLEGAGESAIQVLLQEGSDIDINSLGYVLSRAGKNSPGVLVDLMDSSDKHSRESLATALKLLKSTVAIPRLVTGLNDEEFDVRNACAKALIEMDLSDTKPYLLQGMTSPHMRTRANCAYVLGNINQLDPDFIAPLEAQLPDSEYMVRRNAAWVLGKFGKQANSSIALLINNLKDTNNEVVRYTKEALINIIRANNFTDEQVNEQITAALRFSDPPTRCNVMLILSDFRDSAKPFLEDVIANASDSDAEISIAAIRCLSAIDYKGEKIIPVLLKALQNPGSFIDADGKTQLVRVHAANALSYLSSHPKSAIPILIDALKDSELSVRQAASNALKTFGKEASEAIPALIEVLSDADRQVRLNAITTLRKIEHVPQAIATLKQTLMQDSDSEVRVYAAEIMENIPQFSESCIDNLLYVVQDDTNQQWVREKSVDALISISRYFPKAKQIIEIGLRNSNEQIVYRTLLLLGQYKLNAPEIVPFTCQVLNRTSLQHVAVKALKNLELTPEVLDEFRKAIHHQDSQVRLHVVSALPAYGNKMIALIPEFSKLLQQQSQTEISKKVCDILVKCANPESVQALIAALDNEELQPTVTAALASLGELSAPATDELVKLLGSHNEKVRSNCAWAFGAMRGKAKSAIPTLLLKLSDENKQVRMNCVWALGLIGLRDEEVIEKLQKACEDEDKDIRIYAMISLAQLDAHHAELLPIAQEAIDSSVAMQRQGACYVAGKLGSKSMLYKIVELAESDRDIEVRKEAARSLLLIDPETARTFGKNLQKLSTQEGKTKNYLDNAYLAYSCGCYDISVQLYSECIKTLEGEDLYIAIYNTACCYSLLSENASQDEKSQYTALALEYLEKSAQSEHFDLSHAQKDTDFKTLHANPQCRKILQLDKK